MTKVAVMGCAGRMGKAIAKHVLNSKDLELSGTVVAPGSEYAGQDLGVVLQSQPTGLILTTKREAVIEEADVVIDFTPPIPMLGHARLCRDTKTAFVSGTTGLTTDQLAELKSYADSIPVVFASNMSVGVTLLNRLVEQAAHALDASYDIEIMEMHHREKRDAPSGTALSLGSAALKGRGQSPDHDTRACRTGARQADEISYSSLRGGDVPGDHSVVFAGMHEVIELKHRALDRDVFAAGAIKAARWVKGKAPGLYDMHDVLGV